MLTERLPTMAIETPESDSKSTYSAHESPGDAAASAVAAQGGKRETITSRAKRFIGRPIDPPKERKASKGETKSPVKKPTDKRREQVLQAQRTHRQRTQGYIRELEKEVIRLRERESDCVCHNHEILQQMKRLETLCLYHNVPLHEAAQEAAAPLPTPPHSSLGISTPPYLSNGSSLTPVSSVDQSSTLVLEATAPPTSTLTGLPTAGSEFSNFVNVDFTSAMIGMGHEPFTNFIPEDEVIPPFRQPGPPLPCEMHMSKAPEFPGLTSQQAVDFVLELERVCFPHIDWEFHHHHEESNPPPELTTVNHGSGHVYSATTTLLHHRLPEDPTAQPFQYPKPDLAKLFKSSLHVNFGDDVTPLQIWANLIRINSLGYTVCPEIVDGILKELKKYIQCRGYGAMVPKTYVDALFACYFTGQQYEISWQT